MLGGPSAPNAGLPLVGLLLVGLLLRLRLVGG